MKTKTITYHKSHSYVNEKGVKISVITQLYQIGIYGIINGNPSLQFTSNPKDLAKLEKKLKKEQEEGKITDLQFGLPITVTNESRFWKEVE